MAEKAGIGGQVCIKTETTFATYVAPTVGFAIDADNGDGIERENQYIRSKTIGAGRVAMRDQDHSLTVYDAKGPLNMPFWGNTMGTLLNLLHGNTVTPTSVASGQFKQIHDVGLVGPNGKSITAQVGRPDVSGTVRPFSYSGGKVKQLDMSLERGGVVTSSWDLDFAKEDTAQTLVASPAYDATAGELKFQDASIEYDDVVVTDCIQKADISVGIPLALDRWCIGSGQTKKEQLLNDQISITAKLLMEFTSLTQHTAFVNATRRKLDFFFAGPAISGTYLQSLLLELFKVVPVSSSPKIQSPDIITQEVTFEAMISGANPLARFTYLSADSAIA